MTITEAKRILLLHRPSGPDPSTPEMSEALELARQDLELGQWFKQHQEFQAAMRSKLRQIKVPAGLKESILARQKIIRPAVWWRQPAWLAAAACVAILVALAFLLPRTPSEQRFAGFQERMVGTALREYRMDLVTNSLPSLRQFMAAHGSPADYQVPGGLGKLELTGGGLLRWRGNPVSMVCYDRGDKQMLFLFVMDRSAINDPPSETPSFRRVSNLMTASWVRNDKVYVLAGPDEPEFARKYL